MGSSSPNRDENKKYLKPPPSQCMVYLCLVDLPNLFTHNRSIGSMGLACLPTFMVDFYGFHVGKWWSKLSVWVCWLSDCFLVWGFGNSGTETILNF